MRRKVSTIIEKEEVKCETVERFERALSFKSDSRQARKRLGVFFETLKKSLNFSCRIQKRISPLQSQNEQMFEEGIKKQKAQGLKQTKLKH